MASYTPTVEGSDEDRLRERDANMVDIEGTIPFMMLADVADYSW